MGRCPLPIVRGHATMKKVFLDLGLEFILCREDGHYCGFSIFYVFKHSDGRQDASSFCACTLTGDRVLASAGNGTLTADRVLASAGNGTLTGDRMLASTGNGTLTGDRMLASAGNGTLTGDRVLASMG